MNVFVLNWDEVGAEESEMEIDVHFDLNAPRRTAGEAYHVQMQEITGADRPTPRSSTEDPVDDWEDKFDIPAYYDGPRTVIDALAYKDHIVAYGYFSSHPHFYIVVIGQRPLPVYEELRDQYARWEDEDSYYWDVNVAARMFEALRNDINKIAEML